MADNSVSALFLIALILFAAANPVAHGTFINPNLQGLSVTGQVCCTRTGTCPGQGVPGAVATLSCLRLFSFSSVIGQNTTDVNGFFNITVPAVTGLILGLPVIPCVVNVQLPLNATICPVLATTNGVLTGVVQNVGIVLTQVLGLVQAAVVTGFIRLSL